MATLKFYFERRNYRAYIFVFAISAPLFIYIYIYIFSIRASFHRHWWFIGQQRKGGDHLLFYSKNSTHSRTFRHLVTAAESSCSHLTFRFRACLEQGVPWHSGNYRVWIHAETRTWNDKNIQSFRHLLPTLHVRLLSRSFNLNACIYQTTTQWDLPPYWLMMQCLFTRWCDFR